MTVPCFFGCFRLCIATRPTSNDLCLFSNPFQPTTNIPGLTIYTNLSYADSNLFVQSTDNISETCELK
jgi:hypothetical protein